METFAVLGGLLFFGLPLYYASLMIRAWVNKSHVPVWSAATCLGIWVAQIPVMAVIGLGCAGGGCSGAGNVLMGLLILFLFNIAPLIWLSIAYPSR
jgi:hypothetical protein